MINIRELNDDDICLIYSWISNPDLRKMIGTRGVPTTASHKAWFEKKKNDNNNIINIIEYDDKSVGIIGTNILDKYNLNSEIYLYIGDFSCQKKGIGSIALGLFEKKLKHEYSIHKVFARVFEFNIPSQQLFAKNNYILEGTQIDHYYDKDNDRFCSVYLYGKVID